jgi:hypothetical protein
LRRYACVFGRVSKGTPLGDMLDGVKMIDDSQQRLGVRIPSA